MARYRAGLVHDGQPPFLRTKAAGETGGALASLLVTYDKRISVFLNFP